jgi:hypothetical protein
MSWTKFRALLLVVFSFLIAFFLFLLGDYFFGYRFVTKDLQNNAKPYMSVEYGWYELKRNFFGQDQYGPIIFSVATDSYGFRKQETAQAQTKYDVIFLGDSFTYGINGPWHETFVGMFAKQSGARVLNAGVSSYSPTPYLYQYKKALKNGLLENRHSVVIVIDISDVQDEAAIWTWDEKKEAHPKKMTLNFPAQEYSNNRPTLLEKIHDALPITLMLYRFVRYRLIASIHDSQAANLVDMPRSAFTWKSWPILNKTYPEQEPSGYAPLGVERGLVKISERVSQISDEAKKHYGNVYILVYPWPAQLAHADKFNWSAWVKDLCVNVTCRGVIDTIPNFRMLANKNSNWLADYYLQGDIHFNERGNRVIAEHLLKNLPTKSKTH